MPWALIATEGQICRQGMYVRHRGLRWLLPGALTEGDHPDSQPCGLLKLTSTVMGLNEPEHGNWACWARAHQGSWARDVYLRDIQGFIACSPDPRVEVTVAQGYCHKCVVLHLPWHKHSIWFGRCSFLKQVVLCTVSVSNANGCCRYYTSAA